MSSMCNATDSVDPCTTTSNTDAITRQALEPAHHHTDYSTASHGSSPDGHTDQPSTTIHTGNGWWNNSTIKIIFGVNKSHQMAGQDNLKVL